MDARGPKMANSYIYGHSHQLSLNKFFDPSAPSMRKKKKKKMMLIVAINVTSATHDNTTGN